MNRLALALVAGIAASGAQAQETAVTNDPYQWMEEVEGAKPLAWVKDQNAKTETELAGTPQFKQLEGDIRTILDSDAKIPYVEKIGDHYYNLWKDKNHARGVWRRTTLAEYRKPNPTWETVLDIDALNAAEKETWVWHGAECRKPDNTRCLIALSRGGSDADVTREFDLTTKTWVEGGFYRPAAKGGLGWIDADTVYVYTDFGEGSLTSSGYPRIVKEWKRGTPLASAKVVYEGKADDMYIAAGHDATKGFERDFVTRTIAFYNDELYLRGKDGTLAKVDAPNSAQKSVQREWLGLELREPWTVGGKTYKAGSFLVTRFDDFMAGKRDFDVLFEPTDTTSLASATLTQHHIVLNVMQDVKNRLSVLTHTDGKWVSAPLKVGDSAFGAIAASAVDSEESDALWLTVTDYLTPTTLMLADADKPDAKIEPLKTMPTFFDASRDVIEQHFAVSKDGTKVPYFLVRPKDLKFDGTAPTLLYGYGGFEISMTPGYSGGIGKGWLEKGGVYAVANIRGGGEYGPRWHQAALKANRHKAYEDFAAVAEDLATRKITSPAHLGAQGGSNGGLLMGNMLTQYPQLFGAIVVQVPLLDMKRYSHLLAGASWMAEYGNPDTADWDYIKTFSPYHLFDASKTYPPTLFMTSTRDDRVHPGHARKMAAKMLDAGKDVRYYENIEGGHGGAANNAQSAHMNALAYSFLWQQLSQ
ncbi:prolyl oligopeptidase [Pseudoxanthomonas sp. GM95]|uniref:prolyl oligopeptidase family serine peptidase n=1 Tax=Pseudoxanthomonas sp. GM95 TaxID=1881043 RepID=UPI0008BAC896|nr:prolyl oligopeptidase family serine peptidase [Pseudoxanthomonas sp. GM95]SEK48201.1 prolyl oligopeptidase [Pseudoxanthomonas sp. GM95]